MKKNAKHLLSTLILSGFIVMAFGSGDDKEKQEEVKSEVNNTPPIEINASELYGQYEANGVSADKNFKDKILKVTGIVNSIDKDITDNIYVTLKGDDMLGDIQCFFSEDHLDAAANLSKGQKITVTGKCEGKMMNVILRGCIIN